jgi:Uma2 family endonuclease
MHRTTPRPRRWKRDEYYRLAEMGFFNGRRAELIFGEIVEMPPMKNEHAVALGLADDTLRDLFQGGYWVRTQMPLHLGKRSAPEPDLAVVEGRPRDYGDHPDTALLVVEISDTSLAYDRARKAALYAFAGIEDYWIVNLVERRLEVRRRPKRNAGRPRRSLYTDVTYHDASHAVEPLALPGRQVAVAALLP